MSIDGDIDEAEEIALEELNKKVKKYCKYRNQMSRLLYNYEDIEYCIDFKPCSRIDRSGVCTEGRECERYQQFKIVTAWMAYNCVKRVQENNNNCIPSREIHCPL